MRRQVAAFLLACLCAVTASAAEPDFPIKPVRFIVPFAPGNGADIMTRALADQLSKTWKQQVLVDNIPGVGGALAAREFIKARPDGYTYLIGDVGALVVNPLLSSKIGYDVAKDMVPITDVLTTHWVVWTSKRSGIATLADLVAQARANPGKLTYATTGPGSPNFAATELFKMKAGVDLAQIPYKDGNQMRIDVAEGLVTVYLSTFASSKPIIDRLQPLAVAASTRDPNLPTVPTVKEAIGLDDYVVQVWSMLMGRSGMNQDIVDKVYGDIAEVVKKKEVQDKAASVGMEIRGSSPREMAKLLEFEKERYGAVMKRVGVPRE